MKRGGKIVFSTQEVELFVEYPLCCFLSLQQNSQYLRPTRFTEAKFFHPSSTNIYCVLRFGPRPDQKSLGQENRATTIGAVCGKNYSIS